MLALPAPSAEGFAKLHVPPAINKFFVPCAMREDAYLREHPKAHRAHAFLGLCETGDIEAITDLLSAHPSEEEDLEGPEVEVLRYQDPLRCMRSALHIAILAHQYTVAWLLLYFASSLEEYRLPSEVLLEASRLQVARDNGAEKVDIRALRDTDGRTAIDVAKEIGGAWDAWCLPDERGGFAAILASP
ncbi:MAG: hypothetical protein M1837_000230 [Sclerophora amabilis]|nr:MAG: hypothetical protein M1837_000230 [Sclerophora amabilis]